MNRNNLVINNDHSQDSVEQRMEELFESSEEEPFEDSGSEYLPSRSPTPTLLNQTDIGEENIPPNTTDDVEVREGPQQTRKRKRDPAKWKKNVRKANRAKGKAYINTKKNAVPEKQISTDQPCPCAQKCHTKISTTQQNILFKGFYELGNFDLQTSYLFSLISVAPKNRCSLPNQNRARESRRSNTRVYQVPNSDGISTKVCKEFFKKVFQVSDGRINRLLMNKLSVPTPPQDQRGKHPPKNKTSDEQFHNVKAFIEKFPKYESHYTLHKSRDRMFLAPDLNLRKMYSLYCEENATSVSYFMFRKIFNENFNLSFHAPVSDSCKKCDSWDVKIKACETAQDKKELESHKKIHLAKADSAKTNYTKDKECATNNVDVTVLVFDLMKTLPTPVVSTGILYYKRQLWTYCLGIHDVVTNDVTMCMWNETIASRGPEEIGSCLLRYIKEKVHTKKLILYSDQCGGQNRNIKMATLCQYITAHPDIVVESIDHKFFVSGHSYLACDQDFGLISKKKKLFTNIFTPDDWDQVIMAARTKNPFNIMKMKKEHFFSTKKLTANITNRKVTAEGSKVKWLSIQWLQFNKNDKFRLLYKYSNHVDVLFESVNLAKRNTKDMVDVSLDLLYPNGRPISKEKKKDLQDLLPYIPPVYHGFYNNIPDCASVRNTIDVNYDSE